MKKTLFIVAAALFSTVAIADSTGAFGGKVSTQGLGLEYRLPINAQTEIGVNANYLSFNKKLDRSDFDADVNLKLATLGVVGYYYPWDNGFNINGGLYLNKNKGKFDAEPTSKVQSYTINGTTYSSNELKDAHGSVDFNKVAPYLGIGWQSGNRNTEGLSFDANLGVMFHGTPKLSFSAECSGSLARPNNPISEVGCNKLQSDIQTKRDDLQDKLNSYKFFPVASIGFIYRF